VNPKIFGIQLVCALGLAAACASPCAAQSAQPPVGGNPFAGLFKGSPKDQKNRLDLNGSTFVAWDDNVLAQSPQGDPGINFDPRGVKQGIASGFQTSLAYAFSTGGTRSQFSANGNGSLQQFASSAGQSMWFQSYNAGAGMRTGLTSKTWLSIGGGTSYAPYYQYAPFLMSTTNPESPVGADYGYAAHSLWVRTLSATASLENKFSKRSSISGNAGWERRVMPDDPSSDLETLSMNGRFTHNLTRKLAAYVGYGVLQSKYDQRPDQEPFVTQNVDFGLGYGDGITISFARHYTLSLSVGASVAKNIDPVSLQNGAKSTTFVVNGAAMLSRSIGRSWGASAGYNRGTQYVVGFREPLITDAANIGIGGPIFNRLHFSAGGGASTSQQLFSTTGGKILSYTAATPLTFGLLKKLGLYAQASYYNYSIPETVHPFGFTPDLDRRSVSAGLSAWLPLIKAPRVRRTSDPTQQSDRDTR